MTMTEIVISGIFKSAKITARASIPDFRMSWFCKSGILVVALPTLVVTTLAAPPVVGELPFSWSRQQGLVSTAGRLLWNQDWTSGPLLFDGTFCNYPFRFGPAFSSSFQVASPGRMTEPAPPPDSSAVTSHFDYRRGDYLFDQLALGASFGAQNRQVTWQAFKRSFGGATGQYLPPSGPPGPLQQSYRLDYRSHQEGAELEAALARLITHSGIPEAGEDRGLDQDDILLAGWQYRRSLENWTWRLEGTQFVQKRRLDLATLPHRARHFLNRLHLHNRWTYRRTVATRTYLGLVNDQRSYKVKNASPREANWGTLYGGWEGESLLLQGGVTIADGGEARPHLRLEFHPTFRQLVDRYRQLAAWKLEASLGVESKPHHIAATVAGEQSSPLETWLSGALGLEGNFQRFSCQGQFTLVLVANFSPGSKPYPPLSKAMGKLLGQEPPPGYTQAHFQVQWRAFRTWQVRGALSLNSAPSLLTDGVGRRVRIGFSGWESFFAGRLEIALRVWAEGILDRNPEFGFDPFQVVPVKVTDPTRSLGDYWVGHFQASARISSFRLSYRIDNLREFFQYPPESPPIINNYYFPALDRLMSFSLTWHFEH